MYVRNLLGSALVLCTGIGGCSSTTATDAGDAGAIDGSDAAPADASDQAQPDASVSFTAMVAFTQLSQNCMPIVAPDPLTFTADILVTNTGGVPLGPIDASAGRIIHENGAALATFTFAAVQIPVIQPGATGRISFTKAAGSLLPANGCNTVACSTPLRAMIPITGPNVPAGSEARSAIAVLPCTF